MGKGANSQLDDDSSSSGDVAGGDQYSGSQTSDDEGLAPVAGCAEDSDDDSNSDKRLNVFVDVAVATDMPIAGRVEIPSTLPSDRLIAARLTLLQ